MTAPDLLYVVRTPTEELRYSLRSAEANLPHERVVIVSGDVCPEWLTGVEWVQTDEGTHRTGKWSRIPAALLRGCEHVGPDAVYLNDDIFTMEPVEAVPALHLGPLHEQDNYGATSPSYRGGIIETERLLRELGVEGELLWYEPHTPLAFRRDAMAAALADALPRGLRCLHYRTLYGNLYRIGGERIVDVKVRSERDRGPAGPFLSTTDTAFGEGAVGRRVRAAFPNPSRYER